MSENSIRPHIHLADWFYFHTVRIHAYDGEENITKTSWVSAFYDLRIPETSQRITTHINESESREAIPWHI